MLNLFALVIIFSAYLIGSFSTAIVVSRVLQLPDPRIHGSNNPGATNVLRIAGKKAAVLTLMGDVLKGFLTVWVAKHLKLSSTQIALVAFFVFYGHLYPVFFNFQGGKGVATALGSLTALAWPLGLSLMITWLLVAILFRYSSLAALTAAFLAPFYAWIFTDPITSLIVGFMSILIIYRHHKNIQKLISGKETKIGMKVHSADNVEKL